MKTSNKFLYGILIGAAASAAVASCVNSVEDYFLGGEVPTHEGTVLEYLSSKPEYSRFVSLVHEVGADETLSGTALVTVWAPVDSLMPEDVASMDPELKKMLVENHITLTTVFSRNLKRLSTVSTVCGKYLNVSTTDTSVVVDGNALSEMDQLYTNGVVHKAGGWMVPRRNMKQWLDGLGDEFSIFRDSLNALSDITFDKANSPILGVDSIGKIIYDSLFNVRNSFISNAKLDNESARFTFFVPTDEAIRRCMDERLEYLSDIYRSDTLSAADTSQMIRWILNASMFRGLQHFNKDSEVSLKSANGKEIRQRYFNAVDSIEYSNGRVFVLDTVYVPKDIHYARQDFNPYFIRKYFGGSMSSKSTTYDSYYNTLNLSTSKVDNNAKTIFLQYNTGVEDNYYQFRTMSYDDEMKTLDEMPVLPGSYRVLFQFVSTGDNKTDQLDVYLVHPDSLQLVGSATGVVKNLYYTSAPNGKNGILNENFKIEGYTRPLEFRVVVPGKQTAGPNRRITIGACALVPLDNY